MLRQEADIKATLILPDQVRLSKSDLQVYLFHRADGEKRWVGAVSKRLNGHGCLVRADKTGAIKQFGIQGNLSCSSKAKLISLTGKLESLRNHSRSGFTGNFSGFFGKQ